MTASIPIPPSVYLSRAQQQFLAWLRDFNPVAYGLMVGAANRSIAGGTGARLGGLGSWWGALVSAGESMGSEALSMGSTILHGAEYVLPKALHLAVKAAPTLFKVGAVVVPAALSYAMAKKVMHAQIARASAGKPPMTAPQQQKVAEEAAIAEARRAAAEAGQRAAVRAAPATKREPVSKAAQMERVKMLAPLNAELRLATDRAKRLTDVAERNKSALSLQAADVAQQSAASIRAELSRALAAPYVRPTADGGLPEKGGFGPAGWIALAAVGLVGLFVVKRVL